jgi:hypothetical protein
MSFLSKFGADFKKVFAWVGSPKGQAIVTTVEGVGEVAADAIDPALAGLNPLITSWTQEIFKAEALSAAAGTQTRSGLQKSAAVLNTITPQVVAFAETNKLPVPVGADLTAANNALVAFLNALGGSAPAAPAAT